MTGARAGSGGRPVAARLPTDAEPGRWDAEIAQRGGHLLQSWRWGEFKRRHGWSVERVASPDHGGAFAQILFRTGGPFSIGYIPRGPVFAPGDGAAVLALFDRIDALCRRRRAVHLIIEPDRPLPLSGTFKAHRFVRGPAHYQPGRTVKVPLLDDDALLGQMHSKTRYSVRLAARRGVVVDRPPVDVAAIDAFYGLLRDTSERNAFGIHDRSYYADFLELFGPDALLLLARVDGVVGAGLIAARFGEEALYMYGGSSTQHRAHGAAFALQFQAMRWARASGCLRYDLWGIPEQDPDTTAGGNGRVAGTRGDDWRGLYKFKTGFGGEIVRYPTTLERRYRPTLSFLAKRFYGERG